MKLIDIFFWPGTKVCERLGVDPKADAGLIRWFFNTLFYLIIGLAIVWLVVA